MASGVNSSLKTKHKHCCKNCGRPIKKRGQCLNCEVQEEKLNLPLHQKVEAEVDDEYWLLKKRIQLKYDLTWTQARDMVNEAIARLCCDCWNERKSYGCGRKCKE